MNKITNDEIINYLDYLKNYVLKTENLPSYRIGIFGAGMINYGFAKEIADINAILLLTSSPSSTSSILNILYLLDPCIINAPDNAKPHIAFSDLEQCDTSSVVNPINSE